MGRYQVASAGSTADVLLRTSMKNGPSKCLPPNLPRLTLDPLQLLLSVLHLFYWVEVHLYIPDPGISHKRGRRRGKACGSVWSGHSRRLLLLSVHPLLDESLRAYTVLEQMCSALAPASECSNPWARMPPPASLLKGNICPHDG